MGARPWNEGLIAAKAGRVNLLTCVMKTQERSLFLEFSNEPVFTVWGEVYVRPESYVSSIKQLHNKTIAVMKGDKNGENFKRTAEKMDVQCRYIELASHHEVFHAVAKSEATGGVAPNSFGLLNSEGSGLVQSSIIFSPTHLYFASPKGRGSSLLSSIDKHIKAWKKEKDSPYFDAMDQWFGRSIKHEKVIPTWLIIALLGTITGMLSSCFYTSVPKKFSPTKMQNITFS